MKIQYNVSTDNIHIQDSYKVTKENDMMRLLTKIKVSYFDSSYFFYNMSYNTLLNEWKAHNFYMIYIYLEAILKMLI